MKFLTPLELRKKKINDAISFLKLNGYKVYEEKK